MTFIGSRYSEGKTILRFSSIFVVSVTGDEPKKYGSLAKLLEQGTFGQTKARYGDGGQRKWLCALGLRALLENNQ